VFSLLTVLRWIVPFRYSVVPFVACLSCRLMPGFCFFLGGGGVFVFFFLFFFFLFLWWFFFCVFFCLFFFFFWGGGGFWLSFWLLVIHSNKVPDSLFPCCGKVLGQ